MPSQGEGGARRTERPDYRVYRSRPGLLRRFRKPDLASLRVKGAGGAGGKPPRRTLRGRGTSGAKPPRPPWRRALKWLGIAALGWVLLSFLAFAVSAQIQSSKL